MVKKAPKKDKNKFSVFYNLFHIFPLPLRKKTKPLTFSALFVTGNRKTARENVPLKIFLFFFFLLFCILPLRVIKKNCPLLFFRNFDFKCPKKTLSAQVSFFTNYLFPPLLRQHIHLPKHTPFFLPIMPQKLA